MTEKEVGTNRRRADVDVDEAPLTRAILEAHPEMWPRIGSFVPAGWDKEIARALQAIMALAVETGVKIRVAQIKSKLAGLLLYLDIDEKSAGPSSSWTRRQSAPDCDLPRSKEACANVPQPSSMPRPADVKPVVSCAERQAPSAMSLAGRESRVQRMPGPTEGLLAVLTQPPAFMTIWSE